VGPPGHLAIGLAAKPVIPRVPLLVLLIATEALDLLSFGFLALGIEKEGFSTTDFSQGVTLLSPGSLAWSHGLAMSLIWSIIAAAIAYLVYRNRRIALIVGLVVFSHWLLDFIVHLPDLPVLFNGSPLVGLGLWGSGAGLISSVVLELALLAGGIVFYLISRKWKVNRLNGV